MSTLVLGTLLIVRIIIPLTLILLIGSLVERRRIAF